MKFVYSRSRVHERVGGGVVSIFSFLGFIAFFVIVTTFDWEDVREYAVELFFLLLMVVLSILGSFQKKAEYLTSNAFIKEDGLWMEETGTIPLHTLRLEIFTKNGDFDRYQLRDTEGKLAIYSVVKDELFDYLLTVPVERELHKISALDPNASSLALNCEGGFQFCYSLQDGGYCLVYPDKSEKWVAPDFYLYDPGYKLSGDS